MHVRKFSIGSDIAGLKKITDCGSHSSTDAEIIPLTDWKMRTPFRHSLLVFRSANVGTAHEGIGVFVVTEAERERHDVRILAYGRCSKDRSKPRHMTRHTQTSHHGPKYRSGRSWSQCPAFLSGEFASRRGCRSEKNVLLLAALFERMEFATQDAVQHRELAQGANRWTRQLA